MSMPTPQWLTRPVPTWVMTLPWQPSWDLLALCEAWPERYPCLFESVTPGKVQAGVGLDGQPKKTTDAQPMGRYHLLMVRCEGADQTWTLHAGDDAERFFQSLEAALSAHLGASPLASQPEDMDSSPLEVDLPFYGGWWGYWAYEAAQVFEPSLSLPESKQPLAHWMRAPVAVVADLHQQSMHCVAEPGFESQLTRVYQDWQQVAGASQPTSTVAVQAPIEEPADRFLMGVERIREYIYAGDVFQVNLSRLWQIPLKHTPPTQVYRCLRRANPAPFAAYADFGQWQIQSSSPERLVQVKDQWVATRPIAGTRHRSRDWEKDMALLEELRAHPKEIAEHIMLIDLERNDLGRLCLAGTVQVDELMAIESYRYVHHLVSNIQGQLAGSVQPLAVFRATFPGGTITGCPKVRCMQIIAELEQAAREAYTGSLGYISRCGHLDSNILIRSFIQQEDTLSFRAGAGIVADSEPQKELEETRHKAKGLLKALTL